MGNHTLTYPIGLAHRRSEWRRWSYPKPIPIIHPTYLSHHPTAVTQDSVTIFPQSLILVAGTSWEGDLSSHLGELTWCIYSVASFV